MLLKFNWIELPFNWQKQKRKSKQSSWVGLGPWSGRSNKWRRNNCKPFRHAMGLYVAGILFAEHRNPIPRGLSSTLLRKNPIEIQNAVQAYHIMTSPPFLAFPLLHGFFPTIRNHKKAILFISFMVKTGLEVEIWPFVFLMAVAEWGRRQEDSNLQWKNRKKTSEKAERLLV